LDDLTIKKDNKLLFDSQGPTLASGGAMEIIDTLLANILSNKANNIIVVSVKSTPKSSIEQMELTTEKLAL
jgi:hypothetical protein